MAGNSAAYYAAQSWPDANPRFAWPPPQERKRPADRATGRQAQTFDSITERDPNTHTTVAQRACAFALRRAARIDRTADLLLSLGRVEAAERLSHVAAELRGAAQ